MSNPAILIVEDEEIVSADIADKLRKLEVIPHRRRADDFLKIIFDA
jgi:hypothetical protein